MEQTARSLIRFWFTFQEPVDRGQYLRHGLALVVVKYAVDAALIGVATGTLWTPLDYLQSVPLMLSTHLGTTPAYLATALALWTLPFLWIGVSMTIRRLLDAGWSAWWSLLFFVPLIGYVLLALLTVAPSADLDPADARPEPGGEKVPSALMAMAVGTCVGLATLWLGVVWMHSYGLALFMGMPFVLGLVTAYVLRRRYAATAAETHNTVVMTLLVLAVTAAVVGFEGIVCLAMVAPLGIIVALLGGIVGRRLAMTGEGPVRGAVLIAVLLPAGAAVESGTPSVGLREVRTAVVVDAPADVVWEEVIAFSPIPEPSSILFRLGVAYPVRAHIDGVGVGAVRYCVFSTGAFVEPITAWEPGRRLAFDVIQSPPPLRELSLWDTSPPHLEGYLEPGRGEFRLIELAGGRTRLEGSTWYEQRLRPEGYWVVFSDYLIGRIHERVLNHIRAQAEGRR